MARQAVNRIGPPAIARLVEILGEQPCGSGETVYALLETAEPRPVEELVALRRDRSRPCPSTHAGALLYAYRDARAFDAFSEAAAEEGSERGMAIQGLVALGDPRSAPALIASLDDYDSGVRYSAAAGLGALSGATVRDALARCARRGPPCAENAGETLYFHASDPVGRRLGRRYARLGAVPSSLHTAAWLSLLLGGSAFLLVLLLEPLLVVALALSVTGAAVSVAGPARLTAIRLTVACTTALLLGFG